MQNPIYILSSRTARALRLVALLLASLAYSGAFAATVATDLPDYSPGMTVVITGTDWQPGETVTLHLESSCGCMQSDWTTLASAEGTITNADFLVEEIHLGVAFVLTATGQSSGLTAQTTFTDAARVGSLTVGTQTSNPVCPGSSATYTVTLNRQGSGGLAFSTTLSISNLPPGASGSFSPNPVSFSTSDNTKTSTLTVTTTGGTTSAGSTTFTVSENSNSQTATGILTVDTNAPLVNCSSVPAQSTNADGDCTAIVPDVRSLVRAQSSDTCTAQASLTVTQSPMQGSTVDGAGSHPISVMVSDAAGNARICVVSFIVNDITPPDLKCQPSRTNEWVAGSSPVFDNPTVTDTCDTNLSLSFVDSELPANCPAVRIFRRSWTAIDDFTNSATCSQTLTFIDTTPPILTCQPNGTNEWVAGSVPVFANATAIDACDTNVTLSFVDSELPASCPAVHIFRRTWTATDDCTNTATCSQTITFLDTTPPLITCPTNLIMDCTHLDSGCSNVQFCTYSQGGWGSLPEGMNPGTILSNGFSTVYPGGFVEVGIPGAGGFSMKFTSSSAIAAYIPAGMMAAALNADLVNPANTSAGVFGGQVLALQLNVDFSDASVTPGTTNCRFGDLILADSSSPLFGRSVREILAIANTALGGGNVSSNGVTLGQLNTLADLLNHSFELCMQSTWGRMNLISPEGTSTPPPSEAGTATAIDNADPNPVITYQDVMASGTCFREIRRTWTATDACGNSNSCVQIIRFGDATQPLITCATNKVLECGQSWDFTGPTATDNCSDVIVVVIGTTTNTLCGNTYIATRTWSATDQCGNSNTCSQSITVVDTTPPLITCGTNRTVECGMEWTFDRAAANDICAGTNVLLRIASTVTNRVGFCGNTFAATRTWEALDPCTNISRCSQTVTVRDTTPPVISCPADRQVGFGTTWTFGPPTASDTCGNATISVQSTTTNVLCGRSFIARRTWVAADSCGNSNTCSQTITVIDDMALSVVCAKNKKVTCADHWDFQPPTILGVSNGVSVVVIGTVTNDICGPTFIATRTWEVSDNCGNRTNCSQVVTVKANLDIDCGSDKTVECGQPWDFDKPKVTSCDENDVDVDIVYTTTNYLPDGSYQVTRKWRVHDSCGNEDSCKQIITVRSSTPPYVICAQNKTVECGAAWEFETPLAFGLPVKLVETVTNDACGETFSATSTWEVTGTCGSVARCSQTVRIVDTLAPTLIGCPTNLVIQCGLVPPPARVTAVDLVDTLGFRQIILGSNNVIGGSGCWENSVWNDPGSEFNAFHVVDEQAGSISEPWPGNFWLGRDNRAKEYFVIDLGKPHLIDRIDLFNTHNHIFDDRRTKDFQITAANGVVHAGANGLDLAGATDLILSNRLTLHSLTNDPIEPDIFTPSNGLRQAIAYRYIRFETLSGFNNDDIGLNEIRIFGRMVCDPNVPVTFRETRMEGGTAQRYILTRTWTATDACGNSNSCSQLINVEPIPPALPPLADQMACSGSPVVWIAEPVGNGPFRFQWRHNGIAVPGATNNELSILAVNPASQGQYVVEVSDPCGNATNSAFLTVADVTAATPLAGLVKNTGDSATFSTAATGAGPFTYAWRHNGTLLAGQAGNTLVLQSVTSMDAGTYTVEVGGLCNRLTNSATLAVLVPEPFAANLVSHWKLDEASGDIAADSAGSNHGNLIKGPLHTAGMLGGALSLDGFDDCVVIPHSPSLRLSNSFSISFWLRPAQNLDANSGRRELLNKALNYRVVLNPATNDGRLVFALNSGTPAVKSTTTLWPGTQWSHVACIHDGASLRLYVNGVLEGTSPTSELPGVTPNPLLFGADSEQGGFYAGALDDVRLYSTSLPPTAVASLFHSGRTTSGVSANLALTVNREAGWVRLSWTAVEGFRYRVEYKNDLASSQWIALAGDILATSSTVSKQDLPGPQGRRFYRVVTLPQSVTLP